MEGPLQKFDGGLFNSWQVYYFILHEDTLTYLNKKEGKIVGSIHLKVSKISSVQKDPLQILIYNGTNDVLLRAKSIKEKVAWQNSLIDHQKKTNEGYYSTPVIKKNSRSPNSKVNSSFASEQEDEIDNMLKDPTQEWANQLNLAFTSNLFKPDSPFFMKLAKVWEKEAEMEESMSFIVPDVKKLNNPKLLQHCDKLSQNCNEMKTSITEVVEEIEETRKEMFRVAKLMIQLRDQMVKKGGVNGLNLNIAPSNISVSDTSSQKNYMPQSFHLQSPDIHKKSQFSKQVSSPQLDHDQRNSLLETTGLASNHQQQNLYANIEETKEEKDQEAPCSLDLIRPSEHRSFIGYGGIPITYTMNMRDTLPAMTPEKQSFSIWAILKSSIGKDLSKISMPIWLNEPISMLQKVGEATHYFPILKRAMNEPNDCKRLGLIAIFVLSQYGDVYQRTRKPFNPILGETYEIIQPDFRIMVEQVSHHPPISAFYLEGEGFHYYGNTNVTNKFWGSSMEFKCLGLQHLFCSKYGNEHITIKRPDNSANNIITGNIYVDVHGKMEVINHSKNLKCEINIERQGWTTRITHKCNGTVTDASGNVKFEITGRWSEYLSIKDKNTGQEEEVWRAEEKHPQANRYYNFPTYTMNLNYCDDDMLKTLPPTDCRRRNDQRLMEEGKYDEASQEKHRLEEKQRAQRKEREVNQIEYKPKFFIESKGEDGHKEYEFNNTYWEKRKKNDWRDALDLF